MDISFLRTNFTTVISAVFLILILKTVTVALSASAFGQSLRSSIQTGLYLSQIGEFSFVLAVAGRAYGLITDDTYQIFLAASILTMILTPFMINASPSISLWLTSRPFSRKVEKTRMAVVREVQTRRSGHVIIVGFGMNGRNLARVLRESEVPYVILELNSNTVRKMKKMGEPIFYGDGTSIDILHKRGIDSAKALVIAISDAPATRRIVQIARKANPDLYIIVRTRYVSEVDHLLELGSNEVIPEEFETSIEIFSRVLDHYHIPRNVITGHIDNIRNDCYSVLRGVELPRKHLQNPPPEFVLKSGDILLFIGKEEDIDRAIEYVESGRITPT